MTDQYPDRQISPFSGGFFNPFSTYGYDGTTTGDGSGGGGNRPCDRNRQCPQGKQCIDGVCQDPAAIAPDDGTGGDEETAPDGSRCRPRCGPNRKCRGGVCVPRQGGGNGNGNGNGNDRRRRNRDKSLSAVATSADATAPDFRSFTGLGFTPGADPGVYSPPDLASQGWGGGGASSAGMAQYTPPPNPFYTPAQGRQAPSNPFVTPVGQDNPFMPRRRR